MTRSSLMIGETTLDSRRSLATRRRSRRIGWRHLVKPVTIVLASAVGIAILGHWLLTASLFAIDRVETGRYRYTDPVPLEKCLSSVLGRNIWAYRAKDMKSALQVLPWVREVRVRKILPASLRIDLLEWQPVLTVSPRGAPPQAAASEYVLLANGCVVAFPGDMTPPALPVLAEVKLEPAGPGQWRLQGIGTESVLDLATAIAVTGLEATSAVDFILPQEDGFAVVLRENQRKLQVGREEFTARLLNYIVAKERLQTTADLDLRYRGQIIFKKRT